MPAFTYVASIIVAEVVGIAGAAILGSAGVAFVTSVVAFGLAYGTAKLLGLTDGGGGGTQQDPGVRVQFPPATNNKVPVVYGTANTKGIITDARISNENKTMTYVLVLSEKTQTGTFSIGNIYWNDQLLVFDADAGESHIVRSSIDQNGQGDSNTNFDGLIRMRVYSGGSDSADQIFPPQATGNTVTAYSLLAGSESETDYEMNDLVFAVIQCDYNSEKGVTGLGQITFQVSNTLKNPGLVWYDYMSSGRYGAGIPTAQISTATSISTASTSLYSISNEIPPEQYEAVTANFNASISGTTMTVNSVSQGTLVVGQTVYGDGIAPGTTITAFDSGSGGTGTYTVSISQTISSRNFNSKTISTQVRYEMNGVISTGNPIKTNIEKICQSCASWTTFDYSEGLWKVIVNREATAGELADAFVFNDDNIIGDVGITATNLEDLYNYLEVEFASRKIRDQNDYYRAAIDVSERNDLEPDNTLGMRLEMCNNALHAARVGLIELKQSRVDLIITFRADYSAIQCEAGDVVKINNDVYGFTDKLFRITRLREIEGEDGSLTVEITAMEYNSTVYTDEELYDSPDTPGANIPSFGGSASLPAPSAPVAASISTTTPSFTLSTTISPTSTAPDEIQWWYSSTSTGGFSYFANEYSSTGTFAAGSTVVDIVTLPIEGTFYFQARTGLGSRYSSLSTSSSVGFYWNPNDYGGF